MVDSRWTARERSARGRSPQTNEEGFWPAGLSHRTDVGPAADQNVHPQGDAMTRRRLLAAFLLLSALAFVPRAATLTAAQRPSAARVSGPEYGPPNGALVIAGGSSVGLP